MAASSTREKLARRKRYVIPRHDSQLSSSGSRPTPGWQPVTLVAVLLVGHVVAIWSTRWPTAAATGGPIPSVSTALLPRKTLRIGTFNIHAGKGDSGELDLSRTLSALRELDLDVIGLNEVICCSFWNSDNQADVLGRELSLTSLFAPCERRYGRDWFGNALLSRHGVLKWERQPLPATQERGHRAMLLATLDWQGTSIHVLLTHIDRRRDRASQMQVLADRFLQLPPPAILLGDLNSRADDPQLQRMLSAEDVQDPLSAAGFNGQKRIDWILTRGLHVLDAGMTDRGASDHPACWVELSLDAEPASD